MDAIYFAVFARGARVLGNLFWKVGDTMIIDNGIVNGAARAVGSIAAQVRKMQTGFVYTYAATMVFGLLVMIVAFFWNLWFK